MTTATENSAWCVNCDWTFEGPKADLEARKHMEAEGHATVASSHPVKPKEEEK